MTGSQLIARERERQITAEGYSAAHDDAHDLGELARAAAVYALPEEEREYVRHHETSENGGRDLEWQQPALWPWDADDFKPTPDKRVRELVKAGALIAAEIDRLKRNGG